MSARGELLDLARWAVRQALACGAQEAAASVGGGVSVELRRREGRLEHASESRSRSLGLRLLVDERYSSHGSADLRPDALAAFVARAVAATRLLEPDPDRALPPAETCGEAEDPGLDLWSEAQERVDGTARRAQIAALEEAVLERAGRGRLRSASLFLGDSRSEGAVVFSNGFSSAARETSFGCGGTLVLEDEGGKLPEASAGYSRCHPEDLPGPAALADELWELGLRRLGARPIPSGRYPLLLEHRAVGRLLGILLTPMHGSSLHYGRSCLVGKLGRRVAAGTFSLWDEPHLPRGAGSRLSDGDGFPTRRRALVEGGVLRCYLLGQYFARKLGMEPTSGGTSNLVLAPGPRDPFEIARLLPRAVRVESFLGGNANSTTGDLSLGIRGTLLVRGEPVQAVSEMNLSGNLFEVLERYAEAASDVHEQGTFRVPTVLFDDIQFSGT